MGSVLEEGSYMETQSMLAAGSVLAAGTRVPTGELWMGKPAQFARRLTDAEMTRIDTSSQKYHELAQQHIYAIDGSGGGQTSVWQAEKEGHTVGATEWPACPPK